MKTEKREEKKKEKKRKKQKKRIIVKRIGRMGDQKEGDRRQNFGTRQKRIVLLRPTPRSDAIFPLPLTHSRSRRNKKNTRAWI